MSISNLADLSAAVANYLARADLSTYIADFITLAEARINRDLRIRAMETSTTLQTVAGVPTVALPARYAQMRLLTLDDPPTRVLTYLTPEDVRRRYRATASGKPSVYTLEADSLRFGPTPDAVYNIGCLYYAGFAPLSVGPNWLIGNAPDVYLYATLIEAMPFIGNDGRLALWQALYGQAIEKLMAADQRDRHSGAALMIAGDTGNP